MAPSKSPTKRLKAAAARERSLPKIHGLARQAGILKTLEMPVGHFVLLSDYQFKVHNSEAGLKRAFDEFGLDAGSETDWRLLIRYLADSLFADQPVGTTKRVPPVYIVGLKADFLNVVRSDRNVASMSEVARRLRQRKYFGDRYLRKKVGTLRGHLDRFIPHAWLPKHWRPRRRKKTFS
jgi:hypothetical protein